MELVVENLLRSDALVGRKVRNRVAGIAKVQDLTMQVSLTACSNAAAHAAECLYTFTFDKRAVAAGMRLLENI